MALTNGTATTTNAIELQDAYGKKQPFKVFGLAIADAETLAAAISESAVVGYVARTVTPVTGGSAVGSNGAQAIWKIQKTINGVSVEKTVKTPNPIAAQVTKSGSELTITPDKGSYQAMAAYFTNNWLDSEGVGGWTLVSCRVSDK